MAKKEQFLKEFAWFWLAKSVFYSFSAGMIHAWQKEMGHALFKGYDGQGAKRMGGVDEFAKHVGKRDKLVGIPVEFEKISKNKLIYRMHKCPFLEAKRALERLGIANCREISIKGYLKAKKEYFLGKNWKVRTICCIWNKDKYCEHEYFKRG